MGTSVDDCARKSNKWLDQWQSGKLGAGSRVQSFPCALPSSNDVPVLLLNQPNLMVVYSWWKEITFTLLGLRLCLYYRVFSLTWPASMQIYWNKRKLLHKKRVQLPEDWFGTPTWPPFHCFGKHQHGRRDVMWKHSIPDSFSCRHNTLSLIVWI